MVFCIANLRLVYANKKQLMPLQLSGLKLRPLKPKIVGSIPTEGTNASVAKMVYASDLKFDEPKGSCRVRVPPEVQYSKSIKEIVYYNLINHVLKKKQERQQYRSLLCWNGGIGRRVRLEKFECYGEKSHSRSTLIRWKSFRKKVKSMNLKPVTLSLNRRQTIG